MPASTRPNWPCRKPSGYRRSARARLSCTAASWNRRRARWRWNAAPAPRWPTWSTSWPSTAPRAPATKPIGSMCASWRRSRCAPGWNWRSRRRPNSGSWRNSASRTSCNNRRCKTRSRRRWRSRTNRAAAPSWNGCISARRSRSSATPRSRPSATPRGSGGRRRRAAPHASRSRAVPRKHAARRREAERVLEWQDQMHLAQQRDLLRGDAVKDAANAVQVAEINQKIEELRRAGAQADAIAQYEKLLRTIEADGIHARQNQANTKQAMLDQLAVDEQRLILKQREQEAEWQRELKKMEHEREEKFARWKGDYETLQATQAHELHRIESIGKLSDTGKVATAAAPNAEALTQIMKLQIQGGMSAEQITALAQVVAAEQGVTPAEAARLAHERVLEERGHRDTEMDKDRRHQLDLINLQNASHANAMTSQSQLGIGVAQAGAPVHHHNAPATAPVSAPAPVKYCSNGHPARAGHPFDKFCAECGVPLQP